MAAPVVTHLGLIGKARERLPISAGTRYASRDTGLVTVVGRIRFANDGYDVTIVGADSRCTEIPVSATLDADDVGLVLLKLDREVEQILGVHVQLESDAGEPVIAVLASADTCNGDSPNVAEVEVQLRILSEYANETTFEVVAPTDDDILHFEMTVLLSQAVETLIE